MQLDTREENLHGADSELPKAVIRSGGLHRVLLAFASMKFQSMFLFAAFVVLSLSVSPQARANTASHSTDSFNGPFDCLIEPFVIADVGSSTQGIISQLLVDRGETVVRGQPIARLESSIEQSAADQARARTEMLGEVVTREADLELARLDSERFSALHAKGLAPSRQKDEAVARMKIANAALIQALENRKLLLLELDSTQRLLDQRTINSPVDGVVVSQLVFPGELVFDNPLMTVAQLDPLRIEVVLPAGLFGTIEVGDTAIVTGEIEADVALTARVDVVDPLLDSRSGTFGVRLLLDNDDLGIPAGQKCQLQFSVEQHDSYMPAVNRGPRHDDEPEGLGAAFPQELDIKRNVTD